MKDALLLEAPTKDYEAPEPRELPSTTLEEDVVVENESRRTHALFKTDPRPGIWRKSDWITRSSSVRRRREVHDITPRDFAMAIAKKARSLLVEDARFSSNDSITEPGIGNKTEATLGEENLTRNETTFDNPELKSNYKRETTETPVIEDTPRAREFLLEEDIDNINLAIENFEGRAWHVREGVTREMEDVFLRGASQALTSYIERQLHPAIKETLMLSMGYTISYG